MFMIDETDEDEDDIVPSRFARVVELSSARQAMIIRVVFDFCESVL